MNSNIRVKSLHMTQSSLLNPFSPAEQTNSFANGVDPDETAHNKLSH